MKKNDKNINKLSVIIVNTDKLNNLENCIDSVLKQSYKNIELLFVDNGVNSNFKIIVDKYINDDKRIKYIETDKVGLINNIVTGIKNATGDYVNILSATNTVSVDLYRSLIKKAIDTKSDIVVSNFVEVKNKDEKFINNLMFVPLSQKNDNEVFETYFLQEGLNDTWNFIDNKIFSRSVCLNAVEQLKKDKKILNVNNYISLLFLLFKLSKRLNKVDNDILFYSLEYNMKNKNNAESEVEDLIVTLDFIETCLKDEKLLDKYNDTLQHWRDLYYQKYKDQVQKELLKKLNSNPQAVYEDDYYTIVKTGWNDCYEKIKKKICSKKIKCVSFDIFDTLVVRPFLEPVDLFGVVDKYFRQWTDNKTAMEFTNMRVDSELLARKVKKQENPDSQDITLDDIYDSLHKRYRLDKKLLDKLKQLEIEQEIRFCTARNSGKELYDMAVCLGKKVICTSDMYLPKDVLEKILLKNNYNDLDKIYVSCEYDKTKASGDLYDFVLNDNKLEPEEMVHIGDNYSSDVQNSKKKGIVACHLPKATDIFLDKKSTGCLSAMLSLQMPFWTDTSNSFWYTGIKSMVAVVANKYFDNPYRTFNPNSDFNADPYLIGYYAMGMYMFSLNKWMLDDFQNEDYEKLVFMARDGYLPIRCYKIMKELYKKKPKEEYLYISRKALIPIIVQDKMDFYKLPETLNVEKNTPLDIARYIRNIIDYDQDKFKKLCEENKLPVNKKLKDLDDFYKLIDIILDNFYDKEKHVKNLNILTDYFRNIYGKHSATFDIGYSARPSYFISNLLQDPIDTYFCNINHTQALRHAEMGNFKLKTFFNSKPSTTGHAYEMLVSALAPSCIEYDIVDDKVVEVFEEYSVSSIVSYAMNTIQDAAIEFVQNMVDIFKDDINILYYQDFYASLPFLAYMNSSKEIDKYPLSCVIFEDNLSMGDPLKMISVWHSELQTKNQYNMASLLSMGEVREQFNPTNKLIYNSNVDISKRNKLVRLIFYSLYDRETLKRRIGEITYKWRKKKK